MIPKVIHYCWFGRGPLPELAKKCIASWRKYFPDYEIKRWDEENFDVNAIPYTAEAYSAKKYAFVSDYARFKILYEHGGIYFDTDVEVLKPMDKILEDGGFMGLQSDLVFPDSQNEKEASALSCNPGLGLACAPGLGLACAPGLGLYKSILDLYTTLKFKIAPGVENLTTVVQYTSQVLIERGLVLKPGIMEIEGIRIYPAEYFCPKTSKKGTLHITENTYTIHHFAESWISPRLRLRYRLQGWAAKHLPRLYSWAREIYRKNNGKQ